MNPLAQPLLVLPTFAQPLQLRTRRTLLRQWQDDDVGPWQRMNADPRVRRHFPGLATAQQAQAECDRMRAGIAQRGWGMWVLEIPGRMPFAGTVGLHVTTIAAPFLPAVELGWRLPAEAWGQGYATEAAAAAARFAFERLGLDELVAYTATGNGPSRSVMQRIGMTHDAAGDFDHPGIAADHPLARHVLYRLRCASPHDGYKGNLR